LTKSLRFKVDFPHKKEGSTWDLGKISPREINKFNHLQRPPTQPFCTGKIWLRSISMYWYYLT